MNASAKAPVLRSTFARLIHSDWSVHPRKRWMAQAFFCDGSWHVRASEPVPASDELVALLLDAGVGATLAGFGFPIGLPQAYGELTGFAGFREALEQFGSGEWDGFFEVANDPAVISVRRPFYPHTPKRGLKKSVLHERLGLRAEDLMRRCERKTASRAAASSLFLDPRQQAGWQGGDRRMAGDHPTSIVARRQAVALRWFARDALVG